MSAAGTLAWVLACLDAVQTLMHDHPGTTVAGLVVLMLWLLSLDINS